MAADTVTDVNTAVSESLVGPPSTSGFGAKESADETRQAQQAFANDTPTDVNFNAIMARSQALTVDTLGKGHEGNQDRRDKLADHFMADIMKKP